MKKIGESSRRRSQEVPNIFMAPIHGASPGHFCDSTAAFLLFKLGLLTIKIFLIVNFFEN